MSIPSKSLFTSFGTAVFLDEPVVGFAVDFGSFDL
jgi:hypothetical protein